MEDEDVIRLCKQVFQNDKTQYQYPNNCSDDEMEMAENRDGVLPEKGKRWKTPAELSEGFVKEYFPDKIDELYHLKGGK